MHALNDDDLCRRVQSLLKSSPPTPMDVDDLSRRVQSLVKSSPPMDDVISIPSVVTDVSAGTANSWKELQVGHYFSA